MPQLVGDIALHVPVEESPYEMIIEYAALQAAEQQDMMSRRMLRDAAVEFNRRWRDAPRFLSSFHDDEPLGRGPR